MTWVGSVASIAETLLPSAPWLAGSRTDTGIMAISGCSGSASCTVSQRRSAPAHMAITTSLTETPKAFLTVLTVPRSTLRNATRRCGVIGRLNGVAGARPDAVGMTSPSPPSRPVSPSRPAANQLTAGPRPGSRRTSSLAMRAACTGRHAKRAAAITASHPGPGGLAGVNGSAGGSSRPSGVRSSSTVSSSAPDAPSIAAW